MSNIGPLNRAILSGLWNKLFDADPNNALYLPQIIRNGYAPFNLPSYDPAVFTGKSQPLPIEGVDPLTLDQACTDPDWPYPPVAKGAPTLNLLDVRMLNLSNMAPVSLTFSDTDPTFTIEVVVGTQALPFILTKVDDKTPNYYFQVDCCDPVSVGSPDCAKTWNTDASGQFDAQVNAFSIQLVVQLNTPPEGNLSISILSITTDIEPKNLQINLNVANAPQWVQQIAQIALNQGVNSKAISDTIQMFLNEPNVIENIETLVNDILAKIGQ